MCFYIDRILHKFYSVKSLLYFIFTFSNKLEKSLEFSENLDISPNVLIHCITISDTSDTS